MSMLMFNAFVMNTGSHYHHGLWRHPSARQSEFNDVKLWIELARLLEDGKFDTIFFADVVGLHGPLDGDYDVNVREGLQIPSNDPSVLISALAVNTEHLGLAFTSSIMQAHPFEFARRISTLDHISSGRVAWNIVTSAQENAARNFGFPRLTPHDERYEWAVEYLEVLFKLWEKSWENDALLKDRDRGIFADPAKVHKINHLGKRYSVEGPHLTSPSPQRTPVLFQAGSSSAGQGFAARYAEGQFIVAPNSEVARENIRSTRALAESYGRRGEDIRFFQGMSFVIGSTEEEALRKEKEYEAYYSPEAFLAHASIGVTDGGRPFPAGMLLRDIKTNGVQSRIDMVRKIVPDREPTVGDLGRLVGRRVPRLVGTPEMIANMLDDWRAAGIDGVNVMDWMLPGSFQEFVDHLMPVLRERGLAKRDYQKGTLRQKMFGRDHLDATHPGAAFRN